MQTYIIDLYTVDDANYNVLTCGVKQNAEKLRK